MEHLLTDRAVITRVTVAANDGPYPSSAENTQATDVPCRVAQRSGRELGGLFEANTVTHRIFFAFGTDVDEADIVTVGGVNYEVELVNADPGRRSHHMEVLCKEVR